MARNETTATSTVLLNGEQAKTELDALEAKAKDLRKAIRESTKIGDMEGLKKYNRELKETQTQMRTVRSEAFNAKKVLDNISGASLKDLYSAQKKIDTLMKNGTVKRRSKEWYELRDANIRVRQEIQAVNKEMAIGQSRFSKFTGGFGKMFAGFAIAGAVFSVIKNGLNSILEFSKAVSELKALTGATGADLKFLKDEAKKLGAQYGKSAKEIVDAMKLVGSAKPELLKDVAALAQMTESTLVLSKATGMSMEDSANNLTTIMNQFGLSAAEGDRVINTLAAGSKYGAKEVDYLGESISKVGVTMKSAGLDLETGVSIMELFGEKGIKAETAGNGFKKVLVELQKDTRNYTNGIFDLNKAIDNNQNIAGNNILLQEKFGTEFFSLAQILFQNKERFQELNEQVRGTNTALEQYADATDNLSGDIDKLKGSWDAFILSLEDGNGPIANTFRSLIQLAKDAVDALSYLSKSDKQNNDSSLQKNIQRNIDYLKKNFSDNPMNDVNKAINQEKARVQKAKDDIDILNKKIATEGSSKLLLKQIEEKKKIINGTNSYINALAGLRQSLKTPIVVIDQDDKDKDKDKNTTTTTKSTLDDKYKKEEVSLQNSMKIRILSLKEMYSQQLISEQLYTQLSDQINLDYLEEKKQLQEKYKKDTIDTEIEITEARIKQAETDKKIAENYYKAIEEFKKIELPAISEENPVIDIESYNLALRLKMLEAFHDKGLTSEEDYLNKLAELYKGNQHEINKYLRDENLRHNQEDFDNGIVGRKQYLDNVKSITTGYYEDLFADETDFANKTLEIANQAASFVQTLAEAEMVAVENKYAEELKAAKKAGKDTTALEDQIESEKKDIKKKYADVEFAITVSKIIAETALAVMKAAPNIPLQIFTGATGLAQLALAAQQRESIKNLWTGGWTGPGDKYAPKGIVHSNEFVANMDATGNRSLRKIFNLVDYAQKTNTVARIDDNTLSKVIGSSRGFASGGWTTPPPVDSQYTESGSTELMALIQQAIAINQALISVLSNGIEANVSVTGKNGIKEATDTYNKLLKNATR